MPVKDEIVKAEETPDLTNIWIAVGAGLFVFMASIIVCLCFALVVVICTKSARKK